MYTLTTVNHWSQASTNFSGATRDPVHEFLLNHSGRPTATFRVYFKDFQLSTWKTSIRMWGKVYICAKNGEKYTDNFK